ncbi:MAG: biopolymer transporter ExbD [Spirochaetales bacterium]|nr:biopolymer transporter ExbD [Spirochaetales bacterium]
MELKSKRRPPAAPLSAMSDIGFLLLIFIMLLSLINYRKEEKIDYPEAQKVEITDADKELEIWISKEGAVTVEGQALDRESLEMLIAQSIAEEPTIRIQLLADRNTPYRYIDGITQILQTLQHRAVGFVVKEDL